MPRKARQKAPECIYHIMLRSVSEILLFRDDEDKDYFLGLLKRYVDKYRCSIYAYCLMDNHVHLHFDPKGFDVSKFMHCLNTAYVRYYNKKYNRHGHVLQGRFESRILSSDEYNLAVSAYIHNNPHDIEGYEGREEAYKYSSYGIYLGIRRDTMKLVDKSFIKGLFNVKEEREFVQRYSEFVSCHRDIGSMKEISKRVIAKEENEYIGGREVIIRERAIGKVMTYIADRVISRGKVSLLEKSKRRSMGYRAFMAYVLRVLCGLKYKDISASIHNITISGCSRLCDKGYELVQKDEFYGKLFNELMSCGITV